MKRLFRFFVLIGVAMAAGAIVEAISSWIRGIPPTYQGYQFMTLLFLISYVWDDLSELRRDTTSPQPEASDEKRD